MGMRNEGDFSLTPKQHAHLAAFLSSLDKTELARGRAYVAEGRVTSLSRRGEIVAATVRGTDTYDVRMSLQGVVRASCTCVAFERMRTCKHVAALAATLGEGGDPTKVHRPLQLPACLWSVFSSSAFFARLAYYSGKRIDASDARWLPLRDWWWRSQAQPTQHTAALKECLLAHAEELQADLDTVRNWTPPIASRPGTAYADLQDQLADRYLALRERVQIRSAPPGPLTGDRHPGLTFSFDPKLRILEVTERGVHGVERPLRWRMNVPLRPGESLRVDADIHGVVDAWELFAMRAALIALAEEKDEAILALSRELDRPLWDHVLEGLREPAPGPQAGETEWSFMLTPSYEQDAYRLLPFSRSTRGGRKLAKWKKLPFEAMYAEGTSPLERDIARVALCALAKPTEAILALGTPQGHELLRLLARHPRVRFSDHARPDPETAAPAEILVGDVAMRLVHAGDGALAPRFAVDEVPLAIEMLRGGAAGFRAGQQGPTLISAYVPPSLRKWLDAAISLGPSLVFPQEAVPRLAAAAQPLLTSGVAELPKEALGSELPYTPTAALRVDWRTDGAAVVEVLIAVHPRAPLIEAGAGPHLFTFVDEGRRAFVERTPSSEPAIANAAREAIDAPLTWDLGVGRTDTIEEALALATWLEQNPLGLPIEVKIGRPPVLTQWEDSARALDVKRQGSWLVLDGALDVAGTKLTLGDVLEAARLARKYVKVADGLFLELSTAAKEKLYALSIAAELGGASNDQTLRVHEAFGGLVADAGSVLGDLRGEDLGVYAKRLATQAKARVRVPPLEDGVLRSYQKEGVAWMLRLASWAPGCVLADDMGLGKTVQTASVMKARASLGPALVVAPASVTSNWIAELARFMPSLTVRWYNDDRDVDLDALGTGDVLVISYGLLQRRAEPLAKIRWSTLVLDEAQYVKNIAAQRTDAVRNLTRGFTIALTGTPLENHLGELFSIVDLAFPGLLGDPGTFRERFRKPIESGKDPARLSTLAKLITPFLLRRTRASVLQELPEREDITEYVNLGPEETKRYLALRKACEQQLVKRKKDETPAQLRIAILAALTRLRQLACDVRLVDPTFEGGSTKITRAVELVQQIADEGNRALVFSQFTQFLDKVRTALEQAGLRVGYLTGETPTTKRRPIIDQFQRGELDVFCVSLLAGGTGLNLTAASYVIHLDPWWNPAAEEQATSRAHRMGQTAPVTVYRLVSRGTIEEAVVEMQSGKRELASAVLEGKGDAKAIGQAELLDLLRFGA